MMERHGSRSRPQLTAGEVATTSEGIEGAPPRPGGRRRPGETRQEILDAARRFLWARPFRDLRVDTLMNDTSVGRSSFYHHFPDRYGLAAALLDLVDDELQEATRDVRSGNGPPGELQAALARMISVWARHGPVIRAISEAAAQDARLEDTYRWTFVQRIIDRIADGIVAAQREGRAAAELDAGEVATLLALMTERYLCDQLGRLPQADPAVPRKTLVMAWARILGGVPH